eukprot:6071176-Amphidinium_carterae.1
MKRHEQRRPKQPEGRPEERKALNQNASQRFVPKASEAQTARNRVCNGWGKVKDAIFTKLPADRH